MKPVTKIKGSHVAMKIQKSGDILSRFEFGSKRKKFMPKSVCPLHQ
jgi:hypothetical protein